MKIMHIKLFGSALFMLCILKSAFIVIIDNKQNQMLIITQSPYNKMEITNDDFENYKILIVNIFFIFL